MTSYGPLMIDIAGTTLTELDRQRLAHPLVGGMILFSRNYESREQLQALCADIHALRQPPLLIAVDHEGGRVQRFRHGFTRLPSMRALGEAWTHDPQMALAAANNVGYVLAAELRALGVDFSFAPVLDLDWGRSGVIGDRAFHATPAVVTRLAAAVIDGMAEAGMACCGKHFPGHGWAEADSHVAMPTDERDWASLADDIAPYRSVALAAVMPAHVIYPKIDARPAGFSPVWIDILRRDVGFAGVVFSDDLSMEGASVAGGIIERAEAARMAGCDMLLVCNAPQAVAELLERWNPPCNPAAAERIAKLVPTKPAVVWENLADRQTYVAGLEAINRLTATSAQPVTGMA